MKYMYRITIVIVVLMLFGCFLDLKKFLEDREDMIFMMFEDMGGEIDVGDMCEDVLM